MARGSSREPIRSVLTHGGAISSTRTEVPLRRTRKDRVQEWSAALVAE